MLVVESSRISRYYRSTIPREVRKSLGLRENEAVEWVLESGVTYTRKTCGEYSGW